MYGTPSVSGRAPATATIRASSSVEIRRGRPPPKRGRNESHPCRLKSWITLRTCDSSREQHPRDLWRAHQRVRRQAGSSPAASSPPRFDCLDNRFNRCPSSGANSRTNTSGGRIHTSSTRIRPDSTPTPEVPPRFQSNVPRRRTSRLSRPAPGASRLPDHSPSRPCTCFNPVGHYSSAAAFGWWTCRCLVRERSVKFLANGKD